MLYVDMSIAKIIKICRRGLVTRRSVSAANKTNHENYESASKASKQRQRQNSTYFFLFFYLFSFTTRLPWVAIRVEGWRDPGNWVWVSTVVFTWATHCFGLDSSRREVRSNPISSIGWSLNSRSFVMRLLVCGWLGWVSLSIWAWVWFLAVIFSIAL